MHSLASETAPSHLVTMFPFSSPYLIVDFVIDIAYTFYMDDSGYIAVIRDGISRLEKLYAERVSIDGEIMKTEQLIAATANMLPDEVRDLAIKGIENLQELNRVRDAGLTDAVRVILKAAKGEWLTVTNVRDRLSRAGFNFSSYSANPLASISAILRRMKSEEVETTMVDGGVTAYRWKQSDEPNYVALLRAARKAMEEK
jgi:hypothetical protein